jgi:hypothetical protein
VNRHLGCLDFRANSTDISKMTEELRGERLQIMLSPEELEALDNWRFQKHMPSRAAAIRELLKRGLAAGDIEATKPGRKSQDFGVTDGTSFPAGDGTKK